MTPDNGPDGATAPPAVRTRTASPHTLAEAGAVLRAGGLVAFPTETVYGLGADATQDRAVARIFDAKDRPQFNPLIVHLAEAADAERHIAWLPAAERLAEAFWPGPLTLVLPRRADCRLSPLVSAGLDTAAVRVPAHPVGQALLKAAERPVAAPSANRSGRVSPTRAAHVAAELAGRIDLLIDGGACSVGLESTVIGFKDGAPVLLRPGGLALEEIEAVAGPLAFRPDDPARPTSPGQLASHYAPDAPLRLEATLFEADEAVLAFGPDAPEGPQVLNLSPRGDLTEAAAKLFGHLRALDARGARRIAAMPVPETGLGRAINDRLRRAAAPRD